MTSPEISSPEDRGVFIAAEIGTSHDGDLARARELIAAAAGAGADGAKFQLVLADEILHPRSGTVNLPGGPVALYEKFRSLERPRDFYAQLKEETEARGLVFMASAFGLGSADILDQLGTEVFKIASPEVNHLPLLRRLAGFRRPLILSSGVSRLGDLERAVAILRGDEPEAFPEGRSKFSPLTILHCVTAYPAPEEEYNLRLIPHLGALFGAAAGVSDHSRDPVLVPLLAVLQGATMVEKHFSLDRGGPGLDDPIALSPEDFSRMVREIRAAETEMAADRGEAVRETLDAAYGAGRVEAVLGGGVKRLAPSEAGNYGTTNRSVLALGDIAAGEILSTENSALLRSEKNLSPGMHPIYWEKMLGRPLARARSSGEGILLEDFLMG